MKVARYKFGLAILAGQLYAIGGQDKVDRGRSRNIQELLTIERFDETTNEWQLLNVTLSNGEESMFDDIECFIWLR